MSTARDNIDRDEIAKFDALAARWWDPHGDFAPLHQINPLRLDYIRRRVPLEGRRVLDVGCGGGILAESLAAEGATVTGIDAAEKPLAVARLHQAESGVAIDYRQCTAETLAAGETERYDVVTCLELLEHVPDPAATIGACAALLEPGGDLFVSTINRNPKSFLLAILGAEYLLRLLPAGTHDYARFIRPSELDAWARRAGLELEDSTGMHYHPLTKSYSLGGKLDVNYLMHFHKPADEPADG